MLDSSKIDFSVVWYGVSGALSNKPKLNIIENEFQINLEDEKKHKHNPNHHGVVEENLLKLVSRNVSMNVKPKLKFIEKSKHGITFLVNEDKDVALEKFRKTSLFYYQPAFKEIIHKVLERRRTTSMDSDSIISEHSFNSLELDYHHMSLVDRDSSLVSTMSAESRNQTDVISSRGNLLSKHLRKVLPDLSDVISAEELLNMYVKENYLKIPFSITEKEYVDTYNKVIKNNKVIFKMLEKHVDMFPIDLINVMQNVKRNTSNSKENAKIVDNFEKDLYFYSSLAKSFPSLIDEITDDLKDLNVFYYPLFKTTFELVESIDYLSEFKDEELLKREIFQLNIELRTNRNKPGSLVRWKVMEFIKSCENNYTLTILMANSCGTWLNNLLKCLYSQFSSVREEACISLAFVMTRQTITNELLNSRQYDISYDIFVTIFRVFDQYPENISSLYCLIGYIIQRSVNFEILDFIIDKGPLIKNPFMEKRWPKLFYYALKYWPSNRLVENPTILRKIKDCLHLMILRKVTKKAARLTLFFLSRKYLLKSKICTAWFDVDLGTGKLLSMKSSKG